MAWKCLPVVDPCPATMASLPVQQTIETMNGGDPSGKGLSGSGGSLELCQAAAAKEQDFFEVSDSLCQAAAAKEQDFFEVSDSLCQAVAAKEQDFFEVSDSLCQAAAAKEQAFFEVSDSL